MNSSQFYSQPADLGGNFGKALLRLQTKCKKEYHWNRIVNIMLALVSPAGHKGCARKHFHRAAVCKLSGYARLAGVDSKGQAKLICTWQNSTITDEDE